MYDKLRKSVFPLLAALIWGVAFVAQKDNTAGTFTFNAFRSAVAFLFLLLIIPIFTKGDIKHILSEKTAKETKTLWIGGICCGTALTVASFLQQYGLDSGTQAGKASFLTAMYIVIVPIFGLFLKKHVPVNVWISILIAVAGLYLLCVKQGFSVQFSDLAIVACAFVFSAHILVIDHFSASCNGMKLSCIQFLTAAVISGVFGFIFENPSISGFTDNLGPVLYLGIMSSGVAYTLQIISQKGANPAVLSLLLSMESVFGAVAGAVILNEVMTAKEYIGCALMLAAVILAQIPIGDILKRKSAVKQ